MFRLTPPYDVLLRGTPSTPVGLYHLQIATAEQLTRLHYSMGSLTAIKARLKVLTEQGYTQVDSLPVRQLRSPYFYTLSSRGLAYLRDAGFDTNESWRDVKEVGKHALFIEHTLELNDVLISAALLHKQSPIQLDHFIHERVLKRNPFKTKWQGETLTVIPDAFLKFAAPTGVKRFLLEHDRGTEEQHYFRRRIRAYTALYQEDQTPVIFTTFVSRERVEQMQSWAKSETTRPGLQFFYLSRPPSPAFWLKLCE